MTRRSDLEEDSMTEEGAVQLAVVGLVPRYVWVALACYLFGNGAFEFVLFLRELALVAAGKYQ
jgi:hypothetical protein